MRGWPGCWLVVREVARVLLRLWRVHVDYLRPGEGLLVLVWPLCVSVGRALAWSMRPYGGRKVFLDPLGRGREREENRAIYGYINTPGWCVVRFVCVALAWRACGPSRGVLRVEIEVTGLLCACRRWRRGGGVSMCIPCSTQSLFLSPANSGGPPSAASGPPQSPNLEKAEKSGHVETSSDTNKKSGTGSR